MNRCVDIHAAFYFGLENRWSRDSDDRLNLCSAFITLLLLRLKSSLVADEHDAARAATPGNYEETINVKANKPNPAERKRFRRESSIVAESFTFIPEFR